MIVFRLLIPRPLMPVLVVGLATLWLIGAWMVVRALMRGVWLLWNTA